MTKNRSGFFPVSFLVGANGRFTAIRYANPSLQHAAVFAIENMKITSILPAFNAERFLSEALESVLRQNRPVDEIIVVDDCSTDYTKNVARNYPVLLLSTEQNSGHAAARNLGIEAASGDVIAWLDADDYWNDDHIETVVGLLEQYPNADVAFSGVRMFGQLSCTWSGFPCSGGPTHVFDRCFAETIVPAMSAVTRREPLQAIGGFDSRIKVAPDFDLWLRFARQSLFVSTDRITSNYRRHDSQISDHPYRQDISAHLARLSMIRQLADAGTVEESGMVPMLTEKAVALWENELMMAWYKRRYESIIALLELENEMGGTTETSLRVRRRSRIPKRVITALDTVNNWARTGKAF